MPNFEIISSPIGSQLVGAIGNNDPADKNDFTLFIIADANVTLEQSDVTLSTGASIVSFEGRNSVYSAVIRPPTTAGMLTVSIAQNAVPEGNPAYTKTIRLSTGFPDADAEVATQLFNANAYKNSGTDPFIGIAVTPTRIWLKQRSARSGSRTSMNRFTHAGVEIPGERVTGFGDEYDPGMAKINNEIVVAHNTSARRLRVEGNVFQSVGNPFARLGSFASGPAVYTAFGLLVSRQSGLRMLPYDAAASPIDVSADSDVDSFSTAARDGTLLFLQNAYGHNFVAELTDPNTLAFRGRLNINIGSPRDMDIFQGVLYTTRSNRVYTLDIKKYRQMVKNTKTTVYPQFIKNGETLSLLPFAPDAERIVWDVGFDKPSWLSINANNELGVASNAVTETTPVLLRLRGINRIDSHPFSFYLIVGPPLAPVWRDFTDLTLKQNGSYDLRQVVDADTIVFRSSETQPAGASISGGVLTMGTQRGTVKLRATRGSLHTDTNIHVDIVAVSSPANFSDVFRYSIEIRGIAIPAADVIQSGRNPQISKSLDSIQLTRYRSHSVQIDLVDEAGKYSPDVQGNFWDSNFLNSGGYQEPLKVYLENYVNNAWVKTLMFVGIIEEEVEVISNVQARLTANDISVSLEREHVSNFGTLEKWNSPRRQSDEASFEGVYVPEGSLLPMQVEGSEAWTNQTKLTRQTLQLPTQGPPLENTMYLSAQDMRTAGGYLSDAPLLKFKAYPRSEDVRFLIQQLALARKIYNTEIQLPQVTLETPSIFNRGSVPFSTEKTRITRLPTDWVYDATSKSILILLSNPESHLADQFVKYHIETDDFRVLYTFAKNTKAHRITRRASTLYYILTSEGITQDGSAATGPRHSDKTGYAYDSRAEGSAIEIYEYNSTGNTLTERVNENNTYPPQLGIHYWAGFENPHLTDEFEGIRPDFRGTFIRVGSYLYYRYAKDGEFGVARMSTSGTTERLVYETDLDAHNHLNFAFDLLTDGTLYGVTATRDADTSTLTIEKRTAGGTVSTVFSETRAIGDFNEIGEDWGDFLGCFEALFHNNILYLLVPIQKIEFGQDAKSHTANPTITAEQRSAEKTGERNVTSATGLNPSSTRLAPGDDIPLRIDFDGTVSGATQDDLSVYGGTLESFSISADMIDVTIRPDSQTQHKNIIVDVAEDAVSETNEAWRIKIDFETERSRSKTAGLVLYACDVTNTTPTLKPLQVWEFVQFGGVNLTVHDNAVHFVEQPAAAAQFKPYNPDLQNYNESLKYNVLPENQGALKKVNAAGRIESLGSLWYDERPWNIAVTRMLSIGGDLHLTMGYGNSEELLRYNSLASKADNFTHLVYGKKLEFILPTFIPTQNIYAALSELARQVGATLAFDGGLITVADRRAFRAKLQGHAALGNANIAFKDANKDFPTRGYFRAGDEFIEYTGITSGAFTGVQRGELGTDIINHPDETPILYLHALLSDTDVQQITISTDTAQHFNVIRDTDSRFEVRDDADIQRYNTQTYILNLGLTRNENAWVETVFSEYLSELKDLGRALRITLVAGKKTNSLEIGQFVGIKYGPLLYAARIVSVIYGEDAVRLQAKTVPFDVLQVVYGNPGTPGQLYSDGKGNIYA